MFIDKTAVVKAPLYETIADSLEKTILESNQDSFRLPTENEMAEQFGVSRTIIREAMKILRERGLIVSKVGEGATTTRPDSDYLERVILRIVRSNHLSDRNITDIRMIIDASCMRLAAENKTPEFIESLKKNLQEMKDCSDDLYERAKKDVEFHNIIARQSGNELLTIFAASINGIVFDYIHRRILLRKKGIEDGNYFHELLINLLENGTPEEAEAGMRRHLMNSHVQLEFAD